MTAPCRLDPHADCTGTGAACQLHRPACPGPVDLSPAAVRERVAARRKSNDTTPAAPAKEETMPDPTPRATGICPRCDKPDRKLGSSPDWPSPICASCKAVLGKARRSGLEAPPVRKVGAANKPAAPASPKKAPSAKPETRAAAPPAPEPIAQRRPAQGPTPTIPAATPQPPPSRGTHDVTLAVVGDIVARSNAGVEKYGTRLMAGNGRDALMDAYQEALDLCCYLRQAITERDLASGAKVNVSVARG